MARIGVQFLDIEKAALELQGNGKAPTVDNIREVLGTGSKSTIAQHLKAWRAKQTDAQGHLPHDLMALVTGLWKKLHDQADQRIDEAQKTFSQQIEESKQTLTQLYQELSHFKKQLHQSEEMYANERLAKEDVEKKLQNSNQEHAKLNERHQATIQHLDISKTENARLHQLAANIQANLEHYQQTMQQRHIEQTLAIEKQQTIYAQEIAQFKHQLTQQQNLMKPLEQELVQYRMSLEQSEQKNEQLLAKYNITQKQYQEIDRERSVLLEREMNTQERIQALENKSNEDNVRLNELEKKMAVLIDNNERLQQDLKQSQDKVETLRQEKLFLIQEKSQMEGYLQQMKRVEV